MRLAFTVPVVTEKSEALIIKIRSVANLDSVGSWGDVEVSYLRERDTKRWLFAGATVPGLSASSYKVLKALIKRMGTNIIPSPLVLCRNLIAARSPQVVYDESLKKWRNVATMKDGDNVWELVGLKDKTVTAKDETSAVGRAKKLVAELMAEKPTEAANLAAFFTQGCKVKQISSGKAPEAASIAALANPDEATLAKTPVKMVPKSDAEIDRADRSEKEPKKVVAKK